MNSFGLAKGYGTKTKKQLNYHHYKMNSDCHNDTITLLKMINRVKKILLKGYSSVESYLKSAPSLYIYFLNKLVRGPLPYKMFSNMRIFRKLDFR